MNKLLYVEVSEEIEARTWFDKTSGANKTVRKQLFYIHGKRRVAEVWEVEVADGQSPHAPGLYLLGGGSVRKGAYRFEIADPVLVLVSDALGQLQELAKSGSGGARGAA